MNEVVQHQCNRPRFSNPSYRASRRGHAPEELRKALDRALESTSGTGAPWWETVRIDFYEAANGTLCGHLMASENGVWLVGQLWNCTDIVPENICACVGLPAGRTYAQLVRILKPDLVKPRGSSEFKRS